MSNYCRLVFYKRIYAFCKKAKFCEKEKPYDICTRKIASYHIVPKLYAKTE